MASAVQLRDRAQTDARTASPTDRDAAGGSPVLHPGWREPVKSVGLTLADYCGGFRFGRYATRDQLLVLTYHRVLPTQARGRGPRPPDTVYADEFEAQISYLRRFHHIVTGTTLLQFVRGNQPLPPNSVLITFDDGYRNNYLCAFPVLKKHEASALFFIATGFLDDPETHIWFDRLDAALAAWPARSLDQWIGRRLLQITPRTASALRRWLKYSPAETRNEAVSELERSAPGPRPTLDEDTKPLLWTQAREMAAAGMTFGGHTMSHQILAGTSVGKARDEVVRCRRVIENQLQIACWSFSYPNGEREDFRDEDKDSLREAGYLCAFTQIVGLIRPGHGLGDPFALPRVPVPSNGNLRVFKSRASGLYALVRRLRTRPGGDRQ